MTQSCICNVCITLSHALCSSGLFATYTLQPDKTSVFLLEQCIWQLPVFTAPTDGGVARLSWSVQLVRYPDIITNSGQCPPIPVLTWLMISLPVPHQAANAFYPVLRKTIPLKNLVTQKSGLQIIVFNGRETKKPTVYILQNKDALLWKSIGESR